MGLLNTGVSLFYTIQVILYQCFLDAESFLSMNPLVYILLGNSLVNGNMKRVAFIDIFYQLW